MTSRIADAFLEELADQVAQRVMSRLRPVVREQVLEQVAELERLVEKKAARPPRSARSPELGPRRVGIKEVEHRMDVDRATIHRWCKADRFPPPHYIGTRRAWWDHEVEAWERANATRKLRRPTNLKNVPVQDLTTGRCR